jgi:hypothetical protein
MTTQPAALTTCASARASLMAMLALAALIGAMLIPAARSSTARAEDPPSTAPDTDNGENTDAQSKEPKIDPALKLRIQAWIRRLGHEDFAKREEAAEKLTGIGKDALFFLRLAAKSENATVVAGAKKAIAAIEAAIKKSEPAVPGTTDPNRPAKPKELLPGATDKEIDAFIREQLDRIQREFDRRDRDAQNRIPGSSLSIVFNENGQTYRYMRLQDGSFEVTVSSPSAPNAVTHRFASEQAMASADPDLHERWVRNKPREFHIQFPRRNDRENRDERDERESPDDRMRDLDEQIDKMLEDLIAGRKPGKAPAPSAPGGASTGWENTLAAGARCLEVEGPLRAQLGIANDEGCVQIGGFVNRGQLLEAAGVKQFDIVFAVTTGGKTTTIASPADLRAALAAIGEGAAYDIAIMRRGKRDTLAAKR